MVSLKPLSPERGVEIRHICLMSHDGKGIGLLLVGLDSGSKASKNELAP